MRELDLIKQRLKLNIREYTKIIEKDTRSVTRLKRLGIEIRRDMLMLEDNYWEYLVMEVKNERYWTNDRTWKHSKRTQR